MNSSATRRISWALVAVTLVAALLAIVPTADAAVHRRRFKTPEGNIGCLYRSGTLRCEISGGLQPEPKRDCELDWVGIVLDADGKARPLCAGDTARSNDERKLKAGAKWKRDGITCRARRASLRCHNSDHRGFSLSGDDWDTF